MVFGRAQMSLKAISEYPLFFIIYILSSSLDKSSPTSKIKKINELFVVFRVGFYGR